MTKINLLPWREQLREEQVKQLISMALLGLAITAVIVMLMHLTMSYFIDQQETRNKYLQEEIHLLDGKIYAIRSLKDQKEKLVLRINIIKELQANRPLVVHLFDEIARIIPNGIHLTQMVRTADLIVLTGVAESHSQVSTLMRRIYDSPWLSNPKLTKIAEQDKGFSGAHKFQLSIKIKPPQTTFINT